MCGGRGTRERIPVKPILLQGAPATAPGPARVSSGGRRLVASLSHQGVEVVRRLEGLQVDFGRETVVAAKIFQRIFRTCLGGRARRQRWWERMRMKEVRRDRATGPGSVAPTRATKSHTKYYRERRGFLLHTRRCLLDGTVAIFRSSTKGTCDVF